MPKERFQKKKKSEHAICQLKNWVREFSHPDFMSNRGNVIFNKRTNLHPHYSEFNWYLIALVPIAFAAMKGS